MPTTPVVAQATLAAIALHVVRAVGEVHYRAVAVVGAERAVLPGLFVIVERLELVEADEGTRRVACLFLHREQADADRAHQFAVRGARYILAGVQFHGAQDRVVAKRAALHDDLVVFGPVEMAAPGPVDVRVAQTFPEHAHGLTHHRFNVHFFL